MVGTRSGRTTNAPPVQPTNVTKPPIYNTLKKKRKQVTWAQEVIAEGPHPEIAITEPVGPVETISHPEQGATIETVLDSQEVIAEGPHPEIAIPEPVGPVETISHPEQGATIETVLDSEQIETHTATTFEAPTEEVEDDVKPDTSKLLKEWENHVGYMLLNKKKERPLLKCKQSTQSLSSWNVELECKAFKEKLKANPLYKLVDISYEQANKVLVNAFVERWHSETNTFHMPFGEMTITLDDVQYITGLPVEGDALIFDLENQVAETARCEYVQNLIGIHMDKVKKELGGGVRVSRSWLKNNIQGRCVAVQAEGSSSGSNICVDQAVRGYLLYILTCTLFQDQSGDKISIAYLHFLEDLDRVGEWAWGAGVLAHLYRQLSKGCVATTLGLAGYLTLLEAWIYEHFSMFRPDENEEFVNGEMVRSRKWKPTCGIPKQYAMDMLMRTREKLDSLKAADVIWDAYKDLRTVGPSDVCWFFGCIRTLDTVEAYHPDRVLRQFGHIQSVPVSPISTKAPKGKGKGKGKAKKYLIIGDDDFKHYENRLVNISHRNEKSTYDSECMSEYTKWYRTVAIRYLSGMNKGDIQEEDASKATIIAALTHTSENFSEISRKDLHKVIKMVLEYEITGKVTEAPMEEKAGSTERDVQP